MVQIHFFVYFSLSHNISNLNEHIKFFNLILFISIIVKTI